ncbi:transposable element Tc3 transposase [Trichonephila clavipes]|nr:transposable element Tc3 transposase [Trichonephila clavipes]
MMAQRHLLDMFTKGRIVGMLESSRSQTEVSGILNVDQSVISRQWQRFQGTGSVTRQPVSGRPHKSHNPSPRPISGNKCATSEGQYCQSTVFGAHSRHRNTNFKTNCLQETQLWWLVCKKTSSLHSHQVCAYTRSFELEFETSTLECGRVGQCDESRFSLSSDSRRVTKWRERGTRFEPRNITERHHFPSRGVMV